MHSLKAKITMLTVWITVISIAVVALLSVLSIRNAERRKSDQLLLFLCETGKRNLDYYFDNVEQSAKKIAAYTERELDGLDDEKLLAQTERIRKYFEDIAYKTSGVLTYYYRIDPEVSSAAKGFWYTNLDGKGFTEREVTDITDYDTEDTSSLVWFTVPKQTGRAVWLPPYFTENLNIEVVSYNIPIFYRGQFVGVIGIELDYSTLAGQIDSIRLYNNGYAFLTDKDGNLIFHPRITLAALDGDEIPVPEGLLSESSFTRYTYEDMNKQAVWLWLGNGMRLYVSVPENETDGDWEVLVRNVLIAAAGVTVLAVLLSFFFSGRVTRPLIQLTDAARQTNQGNYDFTLDYSGKDEVGTLTQTFKRMADHMKEHISDLNRRANVDALTSVRNRGAFSTYIDEMQTKLDSGELQNAGFAVCVFDCDDLKAVNDGYGHDKGDIYLQTASRLICKVFQHSPVFRTGGDEFAAVLRNEDLMNREALEEKFEKGMEASLSAPNRWEQVRVAMGIAVYDETQDRSVIDTVRRADRKMYLNKKKRKSAGNA